MSSQYVLGQAAVKIYPEMTGFRSRVNSAFNSVGRVIQSNTRKSTSSFNSEWKKTSSKTAAELKQALTKASRDGELALKKLNLAQAKLSAGRKEYDKIVKQSGSAESEAAVKAAEKVLKLQGAYNRAADAVDKNASKVAKLKKEMDGLDKKKSSKPFLVKAKDGFSKVFNSFHKHAGKVKKVKFPVIKISVATAVAERALRALTNQIGDAVKQFDAVKRFPIVMKNFGFSAEQSSKSMEKIRAGVRGLPVSIGDVSTAIAGVSSSIGNLDKATSTILAFTHAGLSVGASAENVKGALVQYSQALNKGKFDMQDFKSINEQVPGLMDQLAVKILGANHKAIDLFEAVKTGKIPFSQLNDALIKADEGVDGFAAKAKNASVGIGAVFIKLKQDTVNALGAIFEALDKAGVIDAMGRALADVGVKMSEFVQWLTTASELTPLWDALGNAFNTAKESFTSLWEAVRPALEQLLGALPPILDWFGRLWNEILKPAVDDLLGLIPSLIETIQQMWEAIRPGVEHLFDVIPPLMDVAKQLWDEVSKIIKDFTPLFKEIFNLVGDVCDGIVKIVKPFIPVIVGAVRLILNAVKDVWPIVQEMWNQVQPVLEKVAEVLGAVLPPVFKALEIVIKVVAAGVRAGMIAIKTVFQVVLAPIRMAVGMLKNIVSGGLGGLRDTIFRIGDNIKGFFQGLANFMGGMFNHLGNMALNAGMAIIRSIGDGIARMAGWLYNKFRQCLGPLGNLLPHSPAKDGPFSGAGWTALAAAGSAIVNQVGSGIIAAGDGLYDDFSGVMAALSPDVSSVSRHGGVRMAAAAGAPQIVQNISSPNPELAARYAYTMLERSLS